MHQDITGVILAGGKSSRMGVNKSFLKIGDKTIIERTRDLMQKLFQENILITNSSEEYESLGMPVFTDIIKGRGPLSGIHSGLVNANSKQIFVISCDLPLMKQELIYFIINYKPDADIKICEAAGFTQPLLGLYNKNILKALEVYFKNWETLTTQGCRIKNFIQQCSHQIIFPENEPFYNNDLFFNMNKPEDYNQILNKSEISPN